MTGIPAEVAAREADLVAAIDDLVARHGSGRSALLPILEALREQRRQISDVAMQVVADRLDLTPVEVQGVVTFYRFLGTEPTGRHVVHLCRTISCAMAGTASVAERLENELGIRFGQTTPDGLVTLVWASCIGMCDRPPAVLLDRQAIGRVTPDDVAELVARLRGPDQDPVGTSGASDAGARMVG